MARPPTDHFDELDPIGHAVLLRVVAGNRQRRRTDVNGRHALVGRCFARQTAMMPLPVPTSAIED